MFLRRLAVPATALILVGCSLTSSEEEVSESSSHAEETSYPRTIEIPGEDDQDPVDVTLDSEPERIAALTYETGELIASLGSADRLVAAQESLTNPAISSHVEEIEDVEHHIPTEGNIDAEAVIATNPDLVLLSTRRGLEEGAAKVLEGAGIPVIILPNHWANTDEVISNIEIVGEALAVEDAADELVNSLKEGLVQEENDDASKPRVLALSNQAGQPFVVAGEAFPLQLLQLAGGRDAGAELGFERSGPISAEQVIAAEPDAILLIDMNGSAEKIFDPLLDNDAIASLSAASPENVMLIEGRKVQAMGFDSTLEGRDAIASWLAEDVNVKE